MNEFAPIVVLAKEESSFLDKVFVKAKEYAPDIPIDRSEISLLFDIKYLEEQYKPILLIVWGEETIENFIGKEFDYNRVYVAIINKKSVPVCLVDIKNPVEGLKKAIRIFKQRIE